MAWTNICDEFLAANAHVHLSKILGDGFDPEGQRAIGLCALLWRNSQAVKATQGTDQEIAEWACYEKGVEHPVEALALVTALANRRVRVLKAIGDGTYEIVDNARHIANREKKVKAGIEGGKKTKELWEKRIAEENAKAAGTGGEGICPGDATAPAMPNSNQFNSNQITSNQAREGNDPDPAVGQFNIAPEFKGDPVLDPALSHISEKTLSKWIQQFEIESLRNTLTNAIEYHNEKCDDLPLGTRLVNWIGRERSKKNGTLKKKSDANDPFGFAAADDYGS